MRFLNIIIFLCMSVISNAFLTCSQKVMIKNIIQDKEVSQEIKTKTKEIIAINYIPWALSQYNIFVYKNRSYLYKTHVPLNDLRQYAILGMIKALERYNASVDFTFYANKYVLGSLHQGVTDLIPLRPLSHTLRMNKQKVPIITFTHENTWLFDKLYKSKQRETDKILRCENKYISHKNEIERINNIVKQQPPDDQRLFYYRYSEETLKEIRTIGVVSELMSCSDETYRKKMNKLIKKISEEINN